MVPFIFLLVSEPKVIFFFLMDIRFIWLIFISQDELEKWLIAYRL